jgi:hypothetical protein
MNRKKTTNEEIAGLLELQEDNPHRVRAGRQAVRARP